MAQEPQDDENSPEAGRKEMSVVGIYFGPKVIGLVETDGRKLLNYTTAPIERLNNENQIDEKVPEQIKLATIIKEELRKNSIEAKSANIILPGRELIIRTFHMPMLASSELVNAVRFEAKKYIPFKVEDLFSDFQVSFDKTLRKNFVLFVGVKKENLDKYVAAVNQLGLKINSIEYAGFGTLRLLKASRMPEKGVQALVTIDLAEDDEVNFVVLEDGLPLFSRDITLTGESSIESRPAKTELSESLEKLKIELRISLDFYLRKFPTKNIKSVLFIAPEEHRSELESFIKERGLQAKFIDTRKLFEKPVNFSASFLKSYSAAINKSVRSQVTVDLVPGKVRKVSAMGGFDQFGTLPFMQYVKFDFKFIFLGALAVSLPYIIEYYKSKPVQEMINAAKAARPAVVAVSPEENFDTLASFDQKYSEKINAVRAVLGNRRFLTVSLDIIPRCIPKGVWLKDMSYGKEGKDAVLLTLEGSAYLGDNDKERDAVNKFMNELKNNAVFSNIFQDVHIVSMGQGQAENILLTNFVISCRSR